MGSISCGKEYVHVTVSTHRIHYIVSDLAPNAFSIRVWRRKFFISTAVLAKVGEHHGKPAYVNLNSIESLELSPPVRQCLIYGNEIEELCNIISLFLEPVGSGHMQ